MGEKMPDKNDPQYKDRYEREVNAGRKFARMVGIDKLAARVQQSINTNLRVAKIVIACIILVVIAANFARIYSLITFFSTPKTATELQDEMLNSKHNNRHDAGSIEKD